jgi:hypothetical protein
MSEQPVHIERAAFWFHTEYWQFYLEDVNFDARAVQDTVDLTHVDVQTTRLAVESGRIIILTETDNPLLVTLAVQSHPPDVDRRRYMHIVEGSLTITGNQLVLMPCPDPVPIGSVFLPPHSYRVRIAVKAIRSSYGDIEYESFEITLWPAPPAGVHLIKRRRMVGR